MKPSEAFGTLIPDPEEVPLLPVDAVAKALGIGRSACYEAISRGEIPHLRLGRRMLVPTADLRRMLRLPERPVRLGPGSSAETDLAPLVDRRHDAAPSADDPADPSGVGGQL